MDTAISIIFFIVGVGVISYLLMLLLMASIFLPEGHDGLIFSAFLVLLSMLIWIQFDNFHLMSWSYLIDLLLLLN